MSSQTPITPMSLFAPIAGQIIPITQVPDPVFSEKLVGDGVAIDPTEQVLVAPFAGEIIQLTNTSHALTLRSSTGLEVLLHIGIDTVLLKGKGFRPLTSEGENVIAGQPLIEFDADFIAQNAKSLMTVIVITNADAVNAQFKVVADNAIAAQEPLLIVTMGDAVAEIEVSLDEWRDSEDIVLPNPAGLHARPAAALAKAAKGFSAVVEISLGDKRVSAKSLTSILNLGSCFGDIVRVHANGPDARAAIDSVTAAIVSGLGEEVAVVETPAEDIVDEPSLMFPKRATLNWLKGVSASPGFAVGNVHQIEEETLELPTDCQESSVEKALLADAIVIAQDQLETRQSALDPEDADKTKIFSAHIELLSDPELTDYANTLIASGSNAAQSWFKSFTSQVEQLKSLDNALLAERAIDLRDVGNRVLRVLLGVEPKEQQLPDNCVLIADDLTPSDTANLDKNKVVGFVTTGGGATSHSAILARSMNIPAIAGIDDTARDIENGVRVILNADQGEMRVNPDDREVASIHDQILKQEESRALNWSNVEQPAITQDNLKIDVVANIGSVKDAKTVLEHGGEGVGLLRSEFLFLNRTTAPSEEDQFKTYRAAAEAIGSEHPLIVRTLDVGGDKPLSYLPLPEEENPFLGERGIRISLDIPGLFRQQLRALLRAAEYGNIHIMFPMVADIRELRLAKQVLEEERAKLNAKAVPVGIMIEVPSAAVMADIFAPEVDFFSVGTNDLTQYTLAMDRGHPKLAGLADALHPSVLRLIKMTVDAADRHGKWVGVCGGIAGDLLAVPLLVGLGIKELSASVPSIPDVKACVRVLNSQKCKELADQSLQFSTAAEVRDYLETTNQYVV